MSESTPNIVNSSIDAPNADARQFETVLAELEAHVQELESGEIPLERALELFETGVRLSRESQSLLDAAEQKIVELTQKNDHIQEKTIIVGQHNV